TARPRVPQAVLSQSTARPYFQRPVFSTRTGRPYYPRMDNVRPRASSSSLPTGFFKSRTVDRPKRPKPIIKYKWVKKESTAGTQAVLPQTKGEKGSVVTSPTQTWRPKGAYLDHRHKNNGSYKLKKFEYVTPWRPKGAYLDHRHKNNGSYKLKKFEYVNPEDELKDHAIIDSGCSESMTGDKDKLSDFKDYKAEYVAAASCCGQISFQDTQTDCIQDTAQMMKLKRLKASIATMTRQTDAEQRRPTIKKLEVKQVEFKLGEDCWEIQV
ncbi:hypothetical protein Tco_1365060, partial [Tanacetum coccineum]